MRGWHSALGRIYREATTEEQERHKRLREQIFKELPDIKQRAQQKCVAALQRGIALQQTMAALKAERIKKGLSLSDMKDLTSIERSTLSRLENNAAANPTVNTLTRYAAAVGKKMSVILTDAEKEDG